MALLPPDGDWLVWITTGPEDPMSTPCTVTMVAYGNKGVSEPVTLGNGRHDNHFQAKVTDEIKVNLGPSKKLGILYKIRVWIEEDEEQDEREASWYLEKVCTVPCHLFSCVKRLCLDWLSSHSVIHGASH